MNMPVILLSAAVVGASIAAAYSAGPTINPKASQPLAPVVKHEGCVAKMGVGGFPIPDRACTPGAINPTITIDVLKDPHFRTGQERNNLTSEAQKASTYAMYGIRHPSHNMGASQTCELDHVVSIELGGADTLDNIWPQCGPDGVVLKERYFKRKDLVENYLASMVRLGKMPLALAQQGIAGDWTQYLPLVSVPVK